MSQRAIRRICIVGGAGFIGGHFVDRLLASDETEELTVYDNFSSGREWHLAAHQTDARLNVIKGDVRDLEDLAAAMNGHDTVIHLASNPDIARAVTDPAVDFDQGTLLTHHVAEAARRCGVGIVLYASGSGVYGDLGEREVSEDYGPLIPVSTYGASKIAGEALLASYAAMFGITARAFRFGNVVGPRQTHGVGFDFIRRLLDDPRCLRILGDGQQSKSYIYVDDVLEAVLTAAQPGHGSILGVQRCDRRLRHSHRDRRARRGRCRPASRKHPVRVLGRGPRLEGRCACRPREYRPHPRAGLEERAHRASGFAGIDGIHAGRRACRAVRRLIAKRSRPAVFLDRDGVLNEAFVRDGVPTPPRSLEEFRVLPGVVGGVR